MRTINVKFLLIMTVSTVATIAAVVGLHYLQTGRISRALLWQAERAQQEDSPEHAVKYLRRYLEFEPHDTERRAELGRLLASEKLATSPRARNDALFLLEPIITRDPERHDLRRLVVRLAMTPPRPRLKLAREHLDVLHKTYPDDGEVAHLLGVCAEADKDNPQAVSQAASFYTLAVKKSPERKESYLRLAALYRGPLQQPDQADAIMNDLVKANSDSAPAYVLRGQYRLKYGVVEEAEADIQRATALAPDDAEVLLTAADVAERRKDWASARKAVRRGTELYPKDARFISARARIEVLDGKTNEALTCLREGIKTLTGPAQADLHWTLINLLLDDSDPEKAREAEQLVAQLQKVSSPAVPYLQARLHHRKQEWQPAAQLLERARHLLEGAAYPNRELLTQIDLFLGECYGQLREPTRQLEAFRRAVAREPNSVAAHVGLAATYRKLGQIDEAIKLYDQIRKLDLPAGTDTVAYWIDLAQLRIEQNLAQRKPSWDEAESAVRQVEGAKPESVEAVLLRAQLLLAQNQLQQAHALLLKAKENQPQQAEFQLALADVAGRLGEWDEAEQLLDQVERDNGDSVSVRLARARHWASRGSSKAPAGIAALGKNVERFTSDDQARLLKGLGSAASMIGELDLAAQFWKALAQHPSHRQDSQLQVLLFDSAMAAGRENDMRAALEAVQKIEGDQGSLARYTQALHLIWQAEKKGETHRLEEARHILDRLASQRPSWPAVPLAKAEIERLQNRIESAIANYRKAIELGDRSARAVRPLVLMLYQAQRYAEANQEIQRLQKDLHTKELKQIAAMISLRTNNADLALEHAQGAVSGQSTDYRDYLWLGQVMAASRRYAEAEQHLRRAVELGETHPETWVALVQVLAGRDRQEAERAVEQASAKLAADQKPLALAQCMEALGRTDEALTHYQSAIAARPDDMRVIRTAVGFFIRLARPGDAEPLLRRVLNREATAADADLAWARRSLAIVLASRCQFKPFKEGLALVGLSLAEPNRIVEDKPLPTEDAVEEQRTRARVLASQKIGRAKAITLFEDLDRRQLQTPDDQFLLIQLYEADGAWARAAEMLRGLMAEHGQQPLYVAYYAQLALRQGKTSDAEEAIRTLEETEKTRGAAPGSLGTVELKVQLHKSQGQHDQAVALLKEHVLRKGARPEEIVSLIGYLSRVQRVGEALDLCEQVWKTCSPEVAGGASVNVLKGAKTGENDYVRVERWLRAALEKKPTSTTLLMHLAELQGHRGKYQEEEALYDQVLRIDPSNIVALNNRAWLMALHSGNGSGARPLIEGALELMGPRPELLDTRAMVHMALNDSQKAIADLEKALTLDTPTAGRYFHLARAYHMAKNPDAAMRAFRKAKELGLDRGKLHPIERTACGKLFDELDRR
jgi:tetratricopeptide (TPR) repeat protein